MRTAYLQPSSYSPFYMGSFGGPSEPYHISILPKPQKQWLSGGKDLLFEAVIKPLHRVVEYDEYLVVKAPTLPGLIDELDISHALTVEFVNPEPAVAELLKRPEKKDEPARFDGALEPPVEKLKSWKRKIHEKHKKRASKNKMANKTEQLDMFGELA